MVKLVSQDYKKKFKQRIILALVGVVFGILLFFLKIENLINVITIILGVLFLIDDILKMLVSYPDKSVFGKSSFIGAAIEAIFGLILCIFPGGVINIIFAIFLIVIPLVKIFLSEDKMATFKDELITIVLGIVLLFFGISSIIQVVRYICGTLVILYALYNMYLAYLDYKKAREEDNILDAKIKEIK